MKNQSGTVKNYDNQPGVVQSGYRRLQGESDDFFYTHTNTYFIIIYIYISNKQCNQKSDDIRHLDDDEANDSEDDAGAVDDEETIGQS